MLRDANERLGISHQEKRSLSETVVSLQQENTSLKAHLASMEGKPFKEHLPDGNSRGKKSAVLPCRCRHPTAYQPRSLESGGECPKPLRLILQVSPARKHCSNKYSSFLCTMSVMETISFHSRWRRARVADFSPSTSSFYPH